MPAMQDEIWQYRLPMLRLAASILHHPQNAEDAVSAAMLQALQKSHTLRDPAALKPWLLKITARCCYDLLRRQKRERDYAPDPSAAFALFECREDSLFSALSLLPPALSQVLILYYYENLTTQEIAGVLGVPGAAVRMRLSRGRQKLKEWLKEETV